MAKTKATTKRAPAARLTLADRLNGAKGFQMGPYKSVHVAHSFASQARRRVRESGQTWNVTVDAETMTVRFSKPRASKGSSQQPQEPTDNN